MLWKSTIFDKIPYEQLSSTFQHGHQQLSFLFHSEVKPSGRRRERTCAPMFQMSTVCQS